MPPHTPPETSQLDTLLLEHMVIANFPARVNDRVHESECVEVLQGCFIKGELGCSKVGKLKVFRTL